MTEPRPPAPGTQAGDDAPPTPPPHWEADIVAADGGTVHVRALPGDQVELSGPAALVADGTVELPPRH